MTFPLQPVMIDCVTRPLNASVHPGLVAHGPKRQSNEEVKTEKTEKAVAKAQAERQKAANIQKVAKLEHEGNTQTGKRQRSGTNTSATTSMSQRNDGEGNLNQPKDDVDDDDPKFDTLLAESVNSRSEYNGSNGSESGTHTDGEPGTPTEEEPDEGPELEDEEPDTNIWLPVKKGKKQKKGVIARDQITAAVAVINIDTDQTPNKSSSDTDAVPATYGYSGFAPDEEQMVERCNVKLQGIEREKLASKYKVYHQGLEGTKNCFETKVVLLTLDTMGVLKPWNTPSNDTIIEVWNLVFGIDYPIDEGDTECFRFVVAKTLIKHAISSWIHKFVDAAEKALCTEFTRQDFQTLEERAKFAQNLLGNMNDMSDKKHPFIWESAYDEPSARQEGIFQGRLVMRTFFEHIQVINSVDADIFSILTISKVHRALLYSVTGTLKLPTDKKSAEFSKTNRGDHTLITPCGEKIIKCASGFLNKISTLKDLQWDDIFNKALAFQCRRFFLTTLLEQEQSSKDDKIWRTKQEGTAAPTEEEGTYAHSGDT
ncbi:hypothetical protein EI94DRAFT_1710120 [Lactarius quietus]|nr:hypothetical protein EI94DRAFT_1710120 [Lactarius quietus]